MRAAELVDRYRIAALALAASAALHAAVFVTIPARFDAPDEPAYSEYSASIESAPAPAPASARKPAPKRVHKPRPRIAPPPPPPQVVAAAAPAAIPAPDPETQVAGSDPVDEDVVADSGEKEI